MALQLLSITRRFGEQLALDSVSIHVRPGDCYGFIGHNGAGKTTAMRIALGLSTPDSGRVIVDGFDAARHPREARARMGGLIETPGFQPTLDASANLVLLARLQGLSSAEANAEAKRLLELVGLATRADDAVSVYSGGMRRRLNLACGILHAPRVLLLDEPTAGVDLRSRARIHAAIAALAADGTAVLASTHDMEEAERLCGRTVLLDAGRVVAAGATTTLVDASGISASLSLRTLRPPPADWLDGLGSVRVLSANGTRATLALDDPAALPVLLARAARAGGDVVELRFDRPTLADAFFKLTGHALRGDGDDGGG